MCVIGILKLRDLILNSRFLGKVYFAGGIVINNEKSVFFPIRQDIFVGF